MTLLITSDVHGNLDKFKEVCAMYPKVDYHINCGDFGLRESYLQAHQVISVAGNIDYFSKLPLMRVLKIDNQKIMIVHGHIEHVKKNLDLLIHQAKKEKVTMCFFGHTHIPIDITIDGIRFINPGSLGYPPYSYVYITKDEVTFKTL